MTCPSCSSNEQMSQLRALRIRFLSWLLHKANAHVGVHRDFYELKDRLLRIYAVRDGDDVQRIRQECYGDDWNRGCDGESCTRCGGTGIYSERWILLERWKLGTRIFHRPVGPTRPRAITYIDGRIKHEHTSHRTAAEARLWLYLLCDRALLLQALRASEYSRWQWRPMLALQKAVFRTSMLAHRFRVRTCPTCHSRFLRPSTHNSWCECRRCERNRAIARLVDPDVDLPF